MRKEMIIRMIDSISTLFYQRKDNEAMKELGTLIEQLIQFLAVVSDKHLNNEINMALVEVLAAMEQRDTILIADGLVHKVLPLVERIGE